jgi:hypothetical protein
VESLAVGAQPLERVVAERAEELSPVALRGPTDRGNPRGCAVGAESSAVDPTAAQVVTVVAVR